MMNRRHGLEVKSILTVPVNDHVGKTVAVIEAINKRAVKRLLKWQGTEIHEGLTVQVDMPFSRDEEALLQSMAVSAVSH